MLSKRQQRLCHMALIGTAPAFRKEALQLQLELDMPAAEPGLAWPANLQVTPQLLPPIRAGSSSACARQRVGSPPALQHGMANMPLACAALTLTSGWRGNLRSRLGCR